MKKYLLSAIAFFAFLANAQELETEEFCGATEKINELWEKNPEAKTAYYKMQGQAASTVRPKSDDKVYIIPIVFHIVHEYGNENISDEQIYRQVEIINEDFRKQNADIVNVIDLFEDIAADTKIEFRLATVDPYGNPTNGITRHFSHETRIGDDFSKFEQWPRGRYLNVWTVRSMKAGTAGYAYYPTGVEGVARFRDGIIIRHNYIGDIGTGSVFNSRALTHEIGHYLGLAHTWGSTNDPGVEVNCSDDDGIEDTPNTIGWTHCNDLYGTSCDTAVVDNIQNYMEYAYCSNMFTAGQAAYMRNILNMDVSQRNNLWTDENLDLSIPEGMEFTPIADFYPANGRTIVKRGEAITIQNWSWRLTGNNQNYTWTLEGAQEETSTAKNPTVIYDTPGWKRVTLTVEQGGVTHSVTKEDLIWVSPDWTVYDGVVEFDFENNADEWVIENQYGYEHKWEVRSDAGVNGGAGIFLDMTNPYENPEMFSDGYFFNDRRGFSESSFVTQPISFQYLTDGVVSFDFACATDGTTPEEIIEELTVYSSTNYGQNWQQRKKISGTSLVNNGSGWSSFYPIGSTVWTTESFTVPASANGNVLFKFVYTGSDNSNNIAIDNIRISGTVAIDEEDKANALSIYPNPSNTENGWNINYDPTVWGGAKAELTDMAGRVISTTVLDANATETNIKANAGAAQGVYFLTIRTGEKVTQNKLILK